jgi:hypothetical protein
MAFRRPCAGPPKAARSAPVLASAGRVFPRAGPAVRCGAVTPQRLLHELEALAARLGVTIRTEPFDKGVLGGRGGLCRVHGKPVIVMDATLGVADKIATLAGALGRFDLEAVSVPPVVRARIDSTRAGRSPVPPRRVVTMPGLARTRPRRPD